MDRFTAAPERFVTAVLDPAAAAPLCRMLLDWFAAADEPSPFPKSMLRAERLPPAILPSLCLLDALPDGEFRFRLFGTALRDGYGQELTGRLLREAETGEPLEFLYTLYRGVVADPKPTLTRTAFQSPIGLIVYDRLISPLADDQARVHWLLVQIVLVSGLRHDITVRDAMAGKGKELLHC